MMVGTRNTSIFDGLRGYAALWVVLGHCCIQTRAPFPALGTPILAVDIFMFISGFLMAWNHFVDDKEVLPSRREIAAFYVKRFFRIAPLFYVLVIPSILFLGPTNDALETDMLGHTSVVPRLGVVSDIILHLSFLFGLFPIPATDTILPDWSLSLEIQFYVVFPFIMAFRKKFGSLTLVLLSVLIMYGAERVVSTAASPAHFEMVAYQLPSILVLKLPMFAAGIVSAQVARNPDTKSLVAAIMAIGIALTFHENLIVPFLLVAAVGSLLMNGENPWATRMHQAMSGPIARRLGDLSYSVYLLHRLVTAGFFWTIGDTAWFGHVQTYGRLAIMVAVVLPITLILSSFTYRYVERPCIRLGSRLSKAIMRPVMIETAGSGVIPPARV